MPSTINTITDAGYTISATGKKVLLAPPMGKCRATCTTPRWELLKDDDEPLAIDCEFQEFKPEDAEKWGHRMGRLAVVNTKGEFIYDVYARYPYVQTTNTKMPPPQFGVTREDLWLRNGAKESKEVEKNLRRMFKGRVIVGHGMRLDLLAVGKVWEEAHVTVDTQHIYGKVALGTLVDRHLTESFNLHDPMEDAKATMLWYLLNYPYKGRRDFNRAPYVKGDYDEEFHALK